MNFFFYIFLLSNVINNQTLTDATHVINYLKVKCLKNKIKGKWFCILSGLGQNFKLSKYFEAPISYRGRSYEEGKKISYKDGIEAVFALFKYKFFKNK